MARLTRDTVHRAFTVSIVSRMVVCIMMSQVKTSGVIRICSRLVARENFEHVAHAKNCLGPDLAFCMLSRELAQIPCPTSISSQNMLYHSVLEVVFVLVSYKAELPGCLYCRDDGRLRSEIALLPPRQSQ